MNNRIKELRKSLGLTQQEFANKLNTSRNNIAGYEVGNREPSNAAINNICREFNVNEEWLRNGTGEMFINTEDEDAEYEQICNELGIKDKRARQIIINYWHFSDEDKALFWNFINKLVKEEGMLKEQKPDKDEPESSGSEPHEDNEATSEVKEAEEDYIKNCSDSARRKDSTASNTTADTDYANKKVSNE